MYVKKYTEWQSPKFSFLFIDCENMNEFLGVNKFNNLVGKVKSTEIHLTKVCIEANVLIR